MELSRKLKHYRLSQVEYESIKCLLGREPRDIEWPLFSALWSEHCSYKSSRVHLKKFATTLKHQKTSGVGENAGVIDLGQGERIAFKMESHNHPSFIEPYQGAATGVGGILRDVFTMGARPIALADFLCFGEKSAPRMREIIRGVVHGIGSYGNCVGVPTITGETQFHRSYNNNVLVNAMAVGYLGAREQVASAEAHGPGNWILYVGSKTGKDGVHGAAMASESFGEDSESKKPNVQIGDPFFEKLLIESCLEVIQKNLVVAIQDMGAAGLTSSCFEMTTRGGVGFDLHLDQVPRRDSTLTPEEILLSESQERMLIVCTPEKFSAIQKVFHKFDLDAVQIGTLRADKRARLYWHGELLTEIDPSLIVDRAPQYQRPYVAPLQKGFPLANEPFAIEGFIESKGSKLGIYEQYDQRVGASTVCDASDEVALVRLPESGRGLGLALGARTSILEKDVDLGALDAVIFPTLRLATKGIRALAVTDCLNFGNPERPEIMGQFVVAVDAIVRACNALQLSVISGNVSFYNETLGASITPTPATGVVGLRDGVDHLPLRKSSPQSDSESNIQIGLVGLKKSLLDHRDQLDGVCALQNYLLAIDPRLRSMCQIKVVGEWGVVGSLLQMGLLADSTRLNPYIENRWLGSFYSVIVAGPQWALENLTNNTNQYSDLSYIQLGANTNAKVLGYSRNEICKAIEESDVFS